MCSGVGGVAADERTLSPLVGSNGSASAGMDAGDVPPLGSAVVARLMLEVGMGEMQWYNRLGGCRMMLSGIRAAVLRIPRVPTRWDAVSLFWNVELVL